MLILLLISIMLTALAQEQSPVIDPDKFTVCAMTINSDDEKKVFQSQISKYPNKFNPVVELTDLGDDWFNKACKSGIRCDQLLISGHFGGEFFGETSKRLSLSELEKAGCSTTCDGILNQPYEVFLMGCNTLSGREEDHRTPAQYLQVLLADGIPLSQAELVVQSRYGNVGDTHKASMQRAFMGHDKQLYGFDSVGPSGKNIKGLLLKYFKKISPVDHLEKLAAKRMTGQIMGANKNLSDSLKVTAFTQCEAGSPKDEKNATICKLQDMNVSLDNKLDLIVELTTKDDLLIYLPYINKQLQELPNQTLTSQQIDTLNLLKNNATFKRQLLGLAEKTHGFGFKKDLLEIAKNLEFISEDEQRDILRVEFRDMFAKPLTEGEESSVCESSENLTRLGVTEADVKNTNFNQHDVGALMCLSFHGEDLVKRVLSTKPKDNETKFMLIHYADEALPVGSKLPAHLIPFLDEMLSKAEDDDSRSSVLGVMAKFTKTTAQRTELAKKIFLKNNDYNGALRYLASAGSKDEKILEIVRKSDNTFCSSCAILLHKNNPNDPEASKFVNRIFQTVDFYLPYQRELIQYFDKQDVIGLDVQKELFTFIKNVPKNVISTEVYSMMKSKNIDPQIKKEMEEIMSK